MQNNAPIGIFDSGVGGTSIWREIHQLLPLEQTIYLADSKYAPYGEKTKDEIVKLSIKNTEKLISLGAKVIIVACNTATTNAIKHLRANYTLPIIAIEPAIKPAALNTKTKAVGILATQGTLNSELFTQTSELYARDIDIIEVFGKGLVPEIEAGRQDGKEVERLLKLYLKPMLDKNIDYLVLGCSHYPYLVPKLKELLPKTVTIIDSGLAVARQTKAVLEHYNLSAISPQPAPIFYTNSDNLEPLRQIVNTDEKRYSIHYLDF